MSRFFIHHPVFAWVIAILITLGGVLAISGLGVESYPNIAPPQVTVSASYPGASAATTEGAVTQVIEQQLTGIANLDYRSEERRVGKECVRTCRSRWAPKSIQKNTIKKEL